MLWSLIRASGNATLPRTDGWSAYSGNIGDVFVYTTALTEAERHQVEAILMTKFVPAPGLTATVALDPVSGDATITFHTTPGLRYKVEYAAALPAAPADWLEVLPGVDTAMGLTMSVVDVGALLNSPQRFYRVVQVP